MLNHTNIGSGYGFGYFPHNAVNVSSAGASQNGVLCWFLSCSGIGQVSGLVVMRELMNRLAASCFNEPDEEHISEEWHDG